MESHGKAWSTSKNHMNNKNSKCVVKPNRPTGEGIHDQRRAKTGRCTLTNALQHCVGGSGQKCIKLGIGVKLQESKTIKLIAYADDIVLLSESESDLQGMAEALTDESKQMGLLTINEEKTK